VYRFFIIFPPQNGPPIVKVQLLRMLPRVASEHKESFQQCTFQKGGLKPYRPGLSAGPVGYICGALSTILSIS